MALGGNALEVDNTQVAKIGSSQELRASFEQTHTNTESRIAKASVSKRTEYWIKQGVTDESEQMRKWKTDVVALCQKETNKGKIETLTARSIGGIDWKNVTDEQVGQLYEIYFGTSQSNTTSFHNQKGEIVRIPSGTTHFVEEIVKTYTKEDGTIDYTSLHRDRQALEFAAGIFGIGDLLFEYIDTITTLQDEERTQELINAANHNLTTNDHRPTTRLNDLNTYEEEQLKLLSEGYEVKTPTPQPTPSPKPSVVVDRTTLPPERKRVDKKPVAKVTVTKPQVKPVIIKPLTTTQTEPPTIAKIQELRQKIDKAIKAEELPLQQLTPDLALTNPERFKLQLFENLRQRNPVAFMIWEKLEKEGVVSKDEINIDISTWTCTSYWGKKIDLGIQPMPPQYKKQVVFEDMAKDYTDEVLYRLSHEVCHKLFYDIATRSNHTSELNNIYGVLIELRKLHPKKGLSALGSIPFYRSGTEKRTPEETQATEDVTELINMWSQDPKYLRRFLNFVSDPTNKSELEKYGLEELEPEFADTIYNNIEHELAAYLTGKEKLVSLY